MGETFKLEKRRSTALSGTTLKVYRYIVSAKGPVRISEIQTDLHFSSPSLAYYHVKKLMDLGMVREEGVGYSADRVVVENFFLFRGILVPYQVAYAAFFGATLLGMAVLITTAKHPVITSLTFIALMVNVAALGVSAYELRRTLRGIP